MTVELLRSCVVNGVVQAIGTQWSMAPGDEAYFVSANLAKWISGDTAVVAQAATRVDLDLGALPIESAADNTVALSRALAAGGTVLLTTPGTYMLETWPANPLVNVTLELGAGVILSDGGASVSGPVVLQRGLWPNGKVASDASTTSGLPTVTSAGIGFRQADVGKLCLVKRGDGTFGVGFAPIISVAGNVATLSGNLTFTATSCSVSVGSDSGQAFYNLLLDHDYVKLPPGLIMGIPPAVPVVRDGCTLEGSGRAFPDNAFEVTNRGTYLLIPSAYNSVSSLDVGVNGVFGVGIGGAQVKNLSIDAFWWSQVAVRLLNWNAKLDNCYVMTGISSALQVSGQGSEVLGSFMRGRLGISHNTVVSANDARIEGNIFDSTRADAAGYALVHLNDSAGTRYIDNHSFAGENYNAHQLLITASGSLVIGNITISGGNIFEVGNNHQIMVSVSGTAKIRGITITGNSAYHDSGFTDNTYDFVNTNGAAGTEISGLTISGNSGRTIPAVNWRSIWGDNGVVAATGVVLAANVFSGSKNVVRSGGPAAFALAANAVADAATRTTWNAA